MTQDTRRAKRVLIKESNILAKCRFINREEEFTANLRDVSATGMQLVVKFPIKIQKGEKLKIFIEVEKNLLEREVEVVWVESIGSEIRIGGKIIYEDSADLIHKLLEEPYTLPVIFKQHKDDFNLGYVDRISTNSISIIAEKNYSIGTVLEIIIDPFDKNDKSKFDIRYINFRKISSVWRLWNIRKFARVVRSRVIEHNKYLLFMEFMLDKRR